MTTAALNPNSDSVSEAALQRRGCVSGGLNINSDSPELALALPLQCVFTPPLRKVGCYQFQMCFCGNIRGPAKCWMCERPRTHRRTLQKHTKFLDAQPKG